MTSVAAVECGTNPTDGCTISQNTTFNTGNYVLPNGITIGGDSFTLDCNGSTLLQGSGGYTATGISNVGRDSVTIKNCVISGYNYGVRITTPGGINPCSTINPPTSGVSENLTINATTGISVEGYFTCPQSTTSQKIMNSEILYATTGVSINGSSRNVISNNIIRGSTGVQLAGQVSFNAATHNNVTGNIFLNNSVSPVHTTSQTQDNNIWANQIYGYNVTYTQTENNYCVSSQGNTYLNGSDGPTCSCLPLLNGLTVTSNHTICSRNYTLSSGILIEEGLPLLNCNGATLIGTGGGAGILNEGGDNLVIQNCSIKNYTYGIHIKWRNTVSCNVINHATNNTLGDNILLDNTYGAFLEDTNDRCTLGGSISTEHHVSRNTFSNNTNRGIVLLRIRDNQVNYNNFLNNIANNSGISNAWNSTLGGNYWSNYDSAGEGCSNANGDQFCDNSYNVNGSINATDYLPFVVQDGWLLGPQASQPMPVQVIANVDMVKGKRTIVRIPITFRSVLSNDTITPIVKLYWNNTLVGTSINTSFSHNQSKNVDFWYTPQAAGNNIEVRTEVNGTSANGINYTDSNRLNLDVIQTRNLKLTYMPVDDISQSFFTSSVIDSAEFINRTYPLKDNGLSYTISPRISAEDLSMPSKEQKVLKRIYRSSLVAGEFPDIAVGIATSGWFNNEVSDPDSSGTNIGRYPAILVEGGIKHAVGHEIGHHFGMCDEYSALTWLRQYFTYPVCPNGDNGGIFGLDNECSPQGCPTTTLQQFSGRPDSTQLYNFMGNTTPNDAWIAEDSYNHLLEEFSHAIPQFASQRILVSGVYNNATQGAVFDDFYILGPGLAHNLSDLTYGNFSITSLNSSGGSVINIAFDLSFILFSLDGNTSEVNETPFTFVIPFSEDVNRIILKKNNTLKEETNRSAHTPLVQITPFNVTTFNNEVINISWNASDADANNLSYAILFSANNGTNYTTIDLDYNSTSLLISSNSLSDCDYCRIKILATDGFNTNSSTSNSFSIDNDLKINNFDIVYQNNTGRIFRIALNNTLNSTIEDIEWSIDLGDAVETSNQSVTLQSREEILFFIYHNYTSIGTYNVTFNSQSGSYIEFAKISATIT
jgi:hypothetical protein